MRSLLQIIALTLACGPRVFAQGGESGVVRELRAGAAEEIAAARALSGEADGMALQKLFFIVSRHPGKKVHSAETARLVREEFRRLAEYRPSDILMLADLFSWHGPLGDEDRALVHGLLADLKLPVETRKGLISAYPKFTGAFPPGADLDNAAAAVRSAIAKPDMLGLRAAIEAVSALESIGKAERPDIERLIEAIRNARPEEFTRESTLVEDAASRLFQHRGLWPEDREKLASALHSARQKIRSGATTGFTRVLVENGTFDSYDADLYLNWIRGSGTQLSEKTRKEMIERAANIPRFREFLENKSRELLLPSDTGTRRDREFALFLKSMVEESYSQALGAGCVAKFAAAAGLNKARRKYREQFEGVDVGPVKGGAP